MKETTRRSPVVFDNQALRTEQRGDWTVVLAYKNEGSGPFLIDLSHMPRYDFQDWQPERLNPLNLSIPDDPGQCLLQDGILLQRMNRTQASAWMLNGAEVDTAGDPAFTETTDATVCLALLGKTIFRIAEKVSALYLANSENPSPFLFQGPFNRVPCQVVVIDAFSENPCILLTCSRGYARDMVRGLLEAGREFDLAPAGEALFSSWLQQRQPKARE
jgi:hypothetical protein